MEDSKVNELVDQIRELQKRVTFYDKLLYAAVAVILIFGGYEIFGAIRVTQIRRTLKEIGDPVTKIASALENGLGDLDAKKTQLQSDLDRHFEKLENTTIYESERFTNVVKKTIADVGISSTDNGLSINNNLTVAGSITSEKNLSATGLYLTQQNGNRSNVAIWFESEKSVYKMVFRNADGSDYRRIEP